MDRKTVAKILVQPDDLASSAPRSYRTHPDKLAPFWPEVVALLEQDPKLKAYVLFEEMCNRHPETFESSWKRTFEPDQRGQSPIKGVRPLCFENLGIWE